MRSLPYITLLGGLSVLALLASERDAAGRSKKRKNRHSHSHGHSHGHDHDEGRSHGGGHSHAHAHAEPKWRVGAGLSMTQTFGDEEVEGEEAEAGGDGHDHSHALHSVSSARALHEGHSHDSGGGGEETESGAEPTLTLLGGYRLTDQYSLNATIGYAPTPGIGDPSLGVTYERELTSRVDLETSFAFTAPLSEASRDSFKTTTLSVGGGPTLRKGRMSYGLEAEVSMSFYSKTVIVEEEPDTEADPGTPLRLQDEDDEGGEEHVDLVEEGTGDREFNRYGLSSTVGYKLAKRWSLAFGLGFEYVTRQFGSSLIETNATLVQGTYTWKSLSGSLGLITSGAGTSVELPTTPGISASVLYIYE